MKKILNLVLSLTIISAVCAGVLAFVDKLTKEPIKKIQVLNAEDAAKRVMPLGVSEVVQKDDVFIGKDSKGEIIGYALRGTDGGGYGGDIVLMVGFESDKKTIVCYQKLVANETPGLGSKLVEDSFINQFRGKKAHKLKVQKDGGEIDAITSATITSRAVCRALKNASSNLSKLIIK